MTKNTLSSILLGLLSILAVACGDAGAGSFEEDLDPSEVLAGDQGGDDEAGANLEDEKDDEAGQDGRDEDGNDDGQDDRDEDVGDEDEVPVVVVGPACGDGNLDASEMCDDGNDKDGDGCSGACEIEVQGEIAIDVAIDALTSNQPPAEASCSGTIDLVVGVEAIAGAGRCLMDGTSNTLDYALDVDLEPGGKVTGEIEVILNGGSHILDVEGSFEDGVLYFEFNGVTSVTQNIRAIWNGEQKAVLD
jgi:cysteine-rich repeat protein